MGAEESRAKAANEERPGCRSGCCRVEVSQAAARPRELPATGAQKLSHGGHRLLQEPFAGSLAQHLPTLLRTEEEAKALFAPLQGTDKVSPQGWKGFFCGAAMGPGLILLEALLVLMGLSLVPGAERRLKTPAARFLYQGKAECRLANGTRGEVRFLLRYIYDRQEIARFDSRRGTFEAVTELGRPDADYWNSQPGILDYKRGEVERFCRHNYGIYEHFLTTRKVQPTVKISPTKAEPLSHHTLLICTAAGYYPSEIKIKWLKNGQEQTEGVGYSDALQNGDWTFQNQVMLETVPERGDIYACQVEHSSREEPITVQWEPQTSDSAKSKVWTGVVGAVLGVVFVAVGLALYLKSGKATPLPPATALIR
ncbi:H-2 class II histocompatibility antigen, E-S beta chain-like [Eublepharis macularius]|uniref:H-2 class II histocompatibility antigen, E-S beta chain-like n=1 Tax=Eublepharis macularius TaxID=481883 RepID=A0AA97KWJ7_EUBMA|nr:H-2 class II histocompatibility antigen, E-S beta chain-like [Eublepharis macularius]